ncbi:hypothetical protein F4819DRAFT_488419 [Hypoxylon fuscum]|nr:hypothetical protein F4819DRAFT_488419 [Hypoxylon fuscum]
MLSTISIVAITATTIAVAVLIVIGVLLYMIHILKAQNGRLNDLVDDQSRYIDMFMTRGGRRSLDPDTPAASSVSIPPFPMPPPHAADGDNPRPITEDTMTADVDTFSTIPRARPIPCRVKDRGVFFDPTGP